MTRDEMNEHNNKEAVKDQNDDDTIVTNTVDDTMTLIERELDQLRIVATGYGFYDQKPTCILSIRTLIRNTNQDLLNDRFKERGRISKMYSELAELDVSLRSQGYSGEQLISESIFCSFKPVMVFNTKIKLELYFKCILSSLEQLKDASCFFNFLNTSKEEELTTMNSAAEKREGYLIKKEGILFGNWKARYFILNSNSLDYYKFKGENELSVVRKGTIELADAIIGKQDTTTENQFGFLILEWIKKPKKFNRYLFYAYSEEERKAWLESIGKVIESLGSTPMTTRDFLKRLAGRENYSYES
ncbi:hypothetical protein BD770DRAFT_394183 [Pilaira anomala]|nr:hypothetical protein BD770DRAFT_394183 [Pilaira anomala]